MKSTVYFDSVTMPGAYFSGQNPMPSIWDEGDIHSSVQIDDTIPEAERAYFGCGKIENMLPYCMQDNYDRRKVMRQYEVIVLENDYLRAEFMPQFGGRLWSLYDKEHKRDLVHHNPVFQPVNFGLRNAWISGGVEWNLGMTGHTPLSMSPVHTAILHLSDGTPVLRMYELERIRQITMQLDIYLPEDSRFLFVRVHLCNTRDETVPAYWWSNIAVNETEDTRVLAPSDEAYVYGYTRGVSLKKMPVQDGIDRSYTTRTGRSVDYFFEIPKEQRKWEAALDGRGEGLIHTSTDLLQGRKIFLWGYKPGGKRWQEFLSVPGEAYLEIQGGLAKTQMQHLPMPAKAKWEWLEAYGYLNAAPEGVHSTDWQEACDCVEAALEEKLPRSFMDRELSRLETELAQSAPTVRSGSGWAALELLRRGEGDCYAGEFARYSQSSIGAEQVAWLQLLREGSFPACQPEEQPSGYQGQAEWIPLLQSAIENGNSDHWHAWLHLGVLYCAVGEWEKAEEAFRTSILRTDNGWARRNLAMVWLRAGRRIEAVEQLRQASMLLPLARIAVECGENLYKMERWQDYAEYYTSLPAEIQANDRMRLMRAFAAAELGELEYALEILNSGIEIKDLREGEPTLSDLWIRIHTYGMLRENPSLKTLDKETLTRRVVEIHPVPAEFDFRVNLD